MVKIFRPLLYFFYGLSYLYKRDKNIWVFGGDFNSFSNGKYLAQYIKRNHPAVKPVWVVRKHIQISKIREEGFEAYYHWSLKGVKYSLKAKYHFLNSYVFDINYWLSGGSTIINLWHGVPLKKLNFDITKGPSAKVFNPKFIPTWLAQFFILRLKSPDYFLATSGTTQDLFSKSFKVKKEHCIIAGYPRNDIFFQNTFSSEDYMYDNVVEYIKQSSKSIIYMPTWRDSKNNFLADSGIDFQELNKVLNQKNFQFFLKLHPLTKIDTTLLCEFSNIHILGENTDVYPYLKNIDVLITDYSSIYIDYLLTDNHIIFYPFDIKDYQNRDRDLYFNYDNVTPGPKAYNFKQLLQLIENIGNNHADFYPTNDYLKIKDMFWKFKDGKSSERIFEYFQALSST